MKASRVCTVVAGIVGVVMIAAACGAEATPTPQATPTSTPLPPTPTPTATPVVSTPTLGSQPTATPTPFSAPPGTPGPTIVPAPAPTPTPPIPLMPAPPTVVTVRLVDNAFQPAAIPLTLGKDYIFVLDSDGKNPHTFTIVRNRDRTGAVAGLEIDVQVAANETKVVQVLVPREAGEFLFYCRFHWPGGMVGTVQVAAGQSTPSTPAPTPPPPGPTPTPGSDYNYG